MENRLGTHKYTLSVRPNELQRSLVYENISLGKGPAYHARIETIDSPIVPRVGGSCDCGCGSDSCAGD